MYVIKEDDIKNKIEKAGFLYIETYHVKNYRRVVYKDVFGYIYDTDYQSIKKKIFPSHFVHPSNKHSIHNIKIWINNKNKDFEIISEEYKGNSEKLDFKCKVCKRVFNMDWSHILRGYNCPLCRISKGERRVENFLIQKKIKYLREYKFKECKNTFLLPFDFYLPDYNFCIEYHGEQHYNPMGYWGGDEKLKRTKKNDKIRVNFCKKNKIKLIVIPYIKFEEIEKILKEALLK